MADHVYRRFTEDDLFETRVHAQPFVAVESGTAGYYGFLGDQQIESASLSLYGGVRARSDVGSYKRKYDAWAAASASQALTWLQLSASIFHTWSQDVADYNVAWSASYAAILQGFYSQITQSDPANATGTAAYYTFDSSSLSGVLPTTPSFGFPFALTPTGSVSLVSGILGQAVHFANETSELSSPVGIPRSPWGDMFWGGDFTIAMWIKTDVTGALGTTAFDIDDGGSNWFRLHVLSTGTTGSLLGWTGEDAGAMVTSSYVFNNQTWHHIAATFRFDHHGGNNNLDVIGDLKFYVDGQLRDTFLSKTITYSGPTSNMLQWEIGGFAYAGESHAGSYDGVQIMSGCASAADIQKWYNYPALKNTPTSSLAPAYNPPPMPPVPAQPQAPAPPPGQPIEVYALDLVDTHSIDKVIGVPGDYPQTGSITVVTCHNYEDPLYNEHLDEGGNHVVTGTVWYEEHFSPISLLYQWYHDHVRTTYQASETLPATIQVVHVPSMFYGRQIATGSVYVKDSSYNALISRSLEYVDDGHGNMILSGTDITFKVGNVFYNEGLIVFTQPLVLTGTVSGSVPAIPFTKQYWNSGTDPVAYHAEFKGSNIIPSKVFMCRMGPGDVNASNNPTYWKRDANGRMVPRYPGNTTWVTAIGIYNEERQLVAVAKLAQPIRKREKDRIDIRLKMDF